MWDDDIGIIQCHITIWSGGFWLEHMTSSYDIVNNIEKYDVTIFWYSTLLANPVLPVGLICCMDPPCPQLQPLGTWSPDLPERLYSFLSVWAPFKFLRLEDDSATNLTDDSWYELKWHPESASTARASLTNWLHTWYQYWLSDIPVLTVWIRQYVLIWSSALDERLLKQNWLTCYYKHQWLREY